MKKFRGPRKAILSDNERDFLKGNVTKTPSDICDFYDVLKKRFTALIQDLILIHDDPVGNARLFKSSIAFSLENKKENWVSKLELNEIVNNKISQELFINEFVYFKIKKISYYWLKIVNQESFFKKDKSNYSLYKKAEKPHNMFRHLSKLKNNEDWLKREGNVLLDAYKQIQDLLPQKKEDAMTYEKIKKMLSNPKLYRDWNKEHNTMSMSAFKRKYPSEYKEIRKKQKIKEFTKNENIRVYEKLLQINKKELQKIEKKVIKKFNLHSLD